MDDARLGDGMTLEDVARELSAMRSDMSDMRSDMSAMRSDLTGRITALDAKVDSVGTRIDAVSTQIDAVSTRLDSVSTRVDSIDERTDSLDSRMRIGFEATHRLIKLGFESVQIVEEKIDRRFDETERQHADHKTVLEAAVKRLFRDAQSPRGPALRRRR